MKAKYTSAAAIPFTGLLILSAISLFSFPVFASSDSRSLVYESADILFYENGQPYIHDTLTNNTDKTVTEIEYGMLAYDRNGSPLKLYWNFLDSSQENSYEYIVRRDSMKLLPCDTKDNPGGWSLYDGETMAEWPGIGDGKPNQTAYSLFCLKQVVFEDGSVWDNPDFENWLDTYAGQKVSVKTLENYYPYEFALP